MSTNSIKIDYIKEIYEVLDKIDSKLLNAFEERNAIVTQLMGFLYSTPSININPISLLLTECINKLLEHIEIDGTSELILSYILKVKNIVKFYELYNEIIDDSFYKFEYKRFSENKIVLKKTNYIHNLRVKTSIDIEFQHNNDLLNKEDILNFISSN